jgi:hypothetical protein
MDPEEQLDLTDQGPLTDMDLEEDTQTPSLATLLKYIPSWMNTADIEQLLQDIPVQPPVVIPARTVLEAVQALDVDAANIFSQREQNLQGQRKKMH